MLCAALDIDGTLDSHEYPKTIAKSILRAHEIGVHIVILSARCIPVLWGIHPEVRKALDRVGVQEFFYNPWSPLSTDDQVAEEKVRKLLYLKRRYEKVVLFDDKMSNILAARRNGIPALKISNINPITPRMIDTVFF